MNSVRHQLPPVSHRSNHPYYENDYPHYYGAHSHYHASSSTDPYHSFHPFHPYPSQSRYASESVSRKRSSSNKRHYYKTDDPSNRDKNLYSQQYQYQQHHPKDPLGDDSTDEDEFLTPLEAEALRNAELNKTVRDASVSTTTGSIHETTDVSALAATDLEVSGAEQHSTFATGGTKKKHDKALGVLVSFFRRLASTPHQQKKQRPVKTKQNKGNIQTMWVSTPLGDVMDQQQQQEVIKMLRESTDITRQKNQPTPHDNATKVASLDRIWVFRCTDTNQQETSPSAVWTGFDYENQVLLSQHSDNENGIEIYDTHIRKGLFPILVLPKRQVCFYAASNDGLSDQVLSLQVACLPNSKNVQFVYRCGPSSSIQS